MSGSKPKVLLIGWDAADWKIINPLLDQGMMPAVNRLVEEGVIADLTSLRPMLSPMLWNSIATGMRPEKHGIHGFIEPDPQTGSVRPISSTSRTAKAVWNILTQHGLRSLVVGWFGSHPAEPIHGVSVSDRYPCAPAPPCEPWPLPDGTVHPERLRDALAKLRMHPTEVPEGAILPIIPKAATIDQEKDPRLAVFAKSLAETCSIHNCATWLLRHEPWDFAGVYYSGIDHFSHTFMDFHPPRRDSVPEDLFDVYKDVVSGAYRFHDMLLERLLQLVPPETTVVLVSDHGFHSDHLRLRAVPREPAGPAAQHRGIGILAMKGPGILRDERIYGASVLDITPTILSIFGLPVGRDMDGRVLVQAFKEPPATDAIESWERAPGACGMHPADLRTDAESAKAVIDQFVALGYVEQEEDQQKSVAKAVRELRYNRARALMDARNPLAALSILSELSSEWPDDYRFRQHLAACYIALSRFLEAKTILLSFVERSEARKGASGKSGVDTDGRHVAEVVEDDAAASSSILVSEARRDWMMGIILHEEGDKERSLECLLRAEKADPSLPNLHILLGGTYLAISRLEDARRAFLRALDTDGDSADGYLGLAQVSLRRRENQDAAEKALIAVGLQHYLPLGHFVLGLALARLGYFDRSIQAFETCLSLIPSFLNAHRCLAALHSRPGGDKNKAGHHRDMVMHISRSRAQPRT